LLDRIGEVRRALAGDIGVILPGVRLRDDLTRDPQGYAIRVRDRIAGEGRLDVDRLLAVAEEPVVARLGTVDREPVYGLPAAWIDHADRERAVEAGALVFDPISVLGSHLAEVARMHAAELLGRQELQTLLEHLRASVPAVVKDVGGEALPIGTLHRAFGLLLREGAWPRDPIGVLETMLEAGTADAEELAEAARRTVIPALLRRRPRAGFRAAVARRVARRRAAGVGALGCAAARPSRRIRRLGSPRACDGRVHGGAPAVTGGLFTALRGSRLGLRLWRTATRTKPGAGRGARDARAGRLTWKHD
jgi:hypothetical protein